MNNKKLNFNQMEWMENISLPICEDNKNDSFNFKITIGNWLDSEEAILSRDTILVKLVDVDS